jgi:hypothetical protein
MDKEWRLQLLDVRVRQAFKWCVSGEEGYVELEHNRRGCQGSCRMLNCGLRLVFHHNVICIDVHPRNDVCLAKVCSFVPHLSQLGLCNEMCHVAARGGEGHSGAHCSSAC